MTNQPESPDDAPKRPRVTKINIYYPKGANRPAVDTDGQDACDVNVIEGDYPGPVVKDPVIESLEVRESLKSNEANICISVRPGEEKIGQLHIGAQFEGKKGLTEECMQGQNDLAGQLGDWLRELLEDAEGAWEFELNAEPCPKSEEPFRALQISANLMGVSVEELREQRKADVTRDVKQESGHVVGGEQGETPGEEAQR